MNNKSAMYSVLAFSLVVAVVCSVFLVASISGTAVTADNSFKFDKTFLFKVVAVMFACCTVALAVFTFLFKKKLVKSVKLSSPRNYAVDCICFALCFALAAYGIVRQITAQLDGDYSKTLLIAPGDQSGLYKPNLFFIDALFASAVYFFLLVKKKLGKDGSVPAALSLFPSITLALKLVCDFLVQNTNGYSKLYNYHLVALCCLLLFAVNETRLYLHSFAPSLYIFFGAVGAMASIVYAVPTLWLNCTGVLNLSTSTEFLYCVTDLVLTACIYVRLFSVGVKGTNSTRSSIGPAVIFDQNED